MSAPTQEELRLDYVPLDEVKRWDRNPKDHDIGLLHTAIGRWGFLNPPLVDERTGLLNAGHGRLETLEQMRASGKQPPPGLIRVDGDGRWLVGVLRGWASKNDADAQARAVADNRTQEAGGWNQEALASVLAELAAAGGGALEGVGYDAEDVDDLLARVGGPPSLEALANTYGEPDAEALWPQVSVRVPPDVHRRYRALLAEAPGETEAARFGALLEAVDPAALGALTSAEGGR